MADAMACALPNPPTQSVRFQQQVDLFRAGFQRMHELRSVAPHLCDVVLSLKDAVVEADSTKPQADSTKPPTEMMISAHRIVLAATIPYFGDLFLQDLYRNSPVVRLSVDIDIEIEHGILNSLIDFAYTGVILITHINARGLLLGAAFLQLDGIRDACRDYLCANLTPMTVLDVRQFGTQLVDQIASMQSLVCAADQFSHQHIVEVSAQFADVNFDHMIAIVRSQQLTNETGKQLFYTAAVRWMRAQPTQPGPDEMSQLFTEIRRSTLVGGTKRIHPLLCKSMMTAAKRRCYGGSRPPGLIYVIASHTGRMWVYDPRTGTKRTIDDRVPGVCNHKPRYTGLVEHADGLLYAFSGSRVHAEPMQTVEVYNTRRGSWRSHTVTQQPKRYGAAVCTLGNRIFLCGGSSEYRSVATVACYLPQTCEWLDDVAPMLQKRVSGCAAVLNGSVYVLGGNCNGQSNYDTVERYDADANVWHQVTPMLEKRSGHGVAELDDRLYACGGRSSFRGRTLNSLEVYDPDECTWQMCAPMQTARNKVQLVANQGKLWALGGFEGGKKSAAITTTEVYDPMTDTWQTMPTMEMPSCQLLATVVATPV